MGLGTNLVLTPKYNGHHVKDGMANVQLRVDELLNSQNDLSTEARAELDKLTAILNDIVGYSSLTTADASKDDTTITVEDAKGFEADDEIIILDVSYIIDSISDNTITLKGGLSVDVPTGTEVVKNSTLNIESLNEKMQILADIFSKTGTANDVFDALVILANQWNNAGKLINTVKGVFDSQTGTLNIDVSAFNFSGVADYDVVGSVSTRGALKASVGFDKVDENTIVVTAWDKACYVEDEIPFNAKDNDFDVVIMISYERPHISFTITDEEDNTTTVA